MFVIGGILGGIAGTCLVGMLDSVWGKSWATGFVQGLIIVACWFLGCVMFEILEDVVTERRNTKRALIQEGYHPDHKAKK